MSRGTQEFGVNLLLMMLMGTYSVNLRDVQIDNSLLRELNPDPEAAAHAPNNYAREVSQGHYVPVRPKPLPEPQLVAVSRKVAAVGATLRTGIWRAWYGSGRWTCSAT